MKKSLSVCAAALIVAVGAYFLNNTNKRSVLPVLEGVEALAQDEKPCESMSPVSIQVECCDHWVYDGVDGQGIPKYRCDNHVYKTATTCVCGNGSCTQVLPC